MFMYFDAGGKQMTTNSSEVFKVTKTGNYAALGALSCGLAALLGALQGVNEGNSINRTNGVKSDVNETSLVLSLTAGGAVVGGLIGMMFKKEKTVYRNNASLSFYPSINTTCHGNLYPALSLRININ
jgi:hypothetical protein